MKIAVTLRLALVLSLTIFASSCGVTRSGKLDYAEDTGLTLPTPAASESVVVFLRPAKTGHGISAIVYDGEEFLSILMARTHFVHRTKPGKHRYMVISESADFMDADLAGGKIYFALVTPRMGFWRARFSLKPVPAGSKDFERLRSWLESSRYTTPNADAFAWRDANHESVLSKRDGKLDQWLAKDERPELAPSDGVTSYP